jgi:PHP family Zn ribbon phosphoesterase
MKRYSADLQLHSCLSPCGSLDNSPANIARVARERNLDIIALTDHNTADNCPALAAVVEEMPGLTAFFGVEATTVEEIHVVCLLPDLDAAVTFGSYVRKHLPDRINDPEYFGDQPVVDREDTIIRFEDAFLAGATDLSLTTLADEVHARHGVILASHIDRSINSVFSQLGLWPKDSVFDGYDISPHGDPERWKKLVPESLPAIRTSDAHFLEDIGSMRTHLTMSEPSFDEFILALHGTEGRRIDI